MPPFAVLHHRFALALLLLLPVCGMAQRGLMDRKRPEIIPTDGKMRRGGLYVAPGITYTLTRFKDEEETVFDSGDSSYTATYDPGGRIGLYLEAGWFHASRDPWIVDYWDFGLAYKQLKGTENSTGLLVRGDSSAALAGAGSFNAQYLTAHVNANKFIQTGDYQFVQLSLGANADYSIGSAHDHTGDPVIDQHVFPPDLIAQVHVKAGYGFKVSRRLLLIPAIETPVFSVVPEDQGLGQLQWFSSLYRPLIFSVRFLFLRYPRGFDCPPPIRHNEFEKHKEYKPDSYHP